MGFFSSTERGNGDGETSFTRVIRSRFYNKSKTKERAVPLPEPAAHREDAQSTYAASVRQPHRPAKAPQTDNVTMSLAQRLNELASANENGLLDDDQYRLLRQNLFERFTAQPDVHSDPSQPRIPPAPSSRISISDAPAHQRLSSVRAPSVRSSRSVSSAMSSLFRRGTVRANSQESLAQSVSSAPPFDTASVRSARPSLSLHGRPATQPSITITGSGSSRLLRQHSLASIQSDATSTTQADGISVISRRTGHRSTKSRGPPSSFNVRFHDSSPPDEHPHDQATLMAMSSAEIRAEIANIEAEGRRLLDAFSGLEISTMAKHQRDDQRPGARGLERSPSTWTLVPNDAASGVVPYSSAPAAVTPSRKRSRLQGFRSNDSLRGSSTHLPLPHARTSTNVSIPENGDVADAEMEEIRGKRDEVRARYERKVEYLHAMLRGAEIREKLAKKKK